MIVPLAPRAWSAGWSARSRATAGSTPPASSRAAMLFVWTGGRSTVRVVRSSDTPGRSMAAVTSTPRPPIQPRIPFDGTVRVDSTSAEGPRSSFTARNASRTVAP